MAMPARKAMRAVAYLKLLAPEWRAVMAQVRATVNRHLPTGSKETMAEA